MTTQQALAKAAPDIDAAAIERVLVQGDLSRLTEGQRLAYYKSLCESVGLNPLTQPFQYITLSGRLTLYARKDATDQLRKLHGVSIEKLEKDRIEDVYVVTAYAKDATGRTDSSTGAVHIGNLKGEGLANALMKAETKAKRRVTLSICGLGMLDETELETVAHHAPREPIVVTAPKELPQDGELRIVEVGEQIKAGGRWYAPVTLSTGVVVRAKGENQIALCRDLCAMAEPVVCETKAVPKKDGTQAEELVTVRRKYAPELPPVLQPQPAVESDVADDVAEALAF